MPVVRFLAAHILEPIIALCARRAKGSVTPEDLPDALHAFTREQNFIGKGPLCVAFV